MDDRQRVAIAALLVTGVVAAALTLGGQPQATFVDDSGEELATITYETAITDEEKREGLMFREELRENHGMLFVYEQEAPRSFWMKNTLIPLDIIFLDSNKEIINIEKAYPEPDTADSELRRYSSDAPAQYVIEVNQNFTDRKGIKSGDRMSFSLR
jgi:uncharacterized membrane protein (UPF0127 family)